MKPWKTSTRKNVDPDLRRSRRRRRISLQAGHDDKNGGGSVEPVISRSDRDALLKFDRSRVKARKADAEAFGQHLLAEFEQQLAREYSFDDDKVWAEATAAAQEAHKIAQRTIDERCEQLGIPKWARPEFSALRWYGRGEAACKDRRAELRKVAVSRVESLVKAAKSQIERDSLDFQSKLLAGALSSAEAKALLNSLPPVESLMPLLKLSEISSKALLAQSEEDWQDA
jgi:hypothetical protein